MLMLTSVTAHIKVVFLPTRTVKEQTFGDIILTHTYIYKTYCFLATVLRHFVFSVQ